LLNGFPGIISVSSFRQLEKWANKTAEQWNRLSPYDDTLRSALPRYLQMLDHQLRSRKMANLDRIDWGEFKAYLNKNEQWLAKNDIPVYLSSLIAFASSQLEALAQPEGMTGTASSSKRAATASFADPNDNNKRQRFAEWGAQVAASIDGDSENIHGSRSTSTPLVTLSAAESEIIALSAATQEAVYLRKLANELGFTQTSPTTLYEDCTAAVALSKENRFRNRSKHIALRWSFVSERQHPSVGDIQVISVSHKIMLADIFASPRPAASFIPFRDSLLRRTSRINPLDSRDASTPDDDASSDE
jgi:hypothetical protein